MPHSILIVDDDGPLRRSLRLGLEVLGFAAHEASNNSAAVELLDRQPIALAMIDVCKPEEGGLQLVRRLQFRHPRLPIVLTSGACWSRRDLTPSLHNVIAFVPKPYNLDELASFLQRKLEQAAAG